jgi:hypothetical protein
MSAALQLPAICGSAGVEGVWTEVRNKQPRENPKNSSPLPPAPELDASLAFYRKHTESMLRRYLYASMLVGRAPALLRGQVGRGWVSSRPVRSFEDAVIFVLDLEKCLANLNPVDRHLLSRIVLQDYTYSETADMLGIAVRTVAYKFPRALDRLTRLLLDTGLLTLPD